jgi:hypothetical protein
MRECGSCRVGTVEDAKATSIVIEESARGEALLPNLAGRDARFRGIGVRGRKTLVAGQI